MLFLPLPETELPIKRPDGLSQNTNENRNPAMICGPPHSVKRLLLSFVRQTPHGNTPFRDRLGSHQKTESFFL
jgi:hypothetical protein